MNGGVIQYTHKHIPTLTCPLLHTHMAEALLGACTVKLGYSIPVWQLKLEGV